MRATRTLLAAVAAALAAGGCGGDETPRAADSRSAGPDPCRAIDTDSGAGDLFRGGTARRCSLSGGRRYVLFEPGDLGKQPAAVVVGLHGVGGPDANPEAMAAASRLDRVAVREGAIAVFAEGEGGAWDERGDLAYFERVLEDLARRRPIDRARVHAIGWSAGGFMVHRLACSLSGRFASVASLHAPLRGTCRPSRPVSVLQVAGTSDTILPFRGGPTALGDTMPSVAAGTARWRRLLGCGPAARTRRGAVTHEVARGCDGGSVVELVSIRGGTHVWYGPDATAPDDAYPATDAAWRFFATRSPQG